MNLFTNPPTGAVWDAATAEQNWLVWQLQPKGDGTAKVPVLGTRNAAAKDAASLTLADALQQVQDLNTGVAYGDLHAYGVGYLAREGSALITVDLDDCLKDGEPIGKAGQIAKDTDTYSEVTVSGGGLRLIMPRDNTPQELKTDRDLGDGTKAGLYASGARFAAISGNAFNCQSELHHDLIPLLVSFDGVLNAKVQGNAFANDMAVMKTERVWHSHWLHQLDKDNQALAIRAMLAALDGTEYHNARGPWLEVTFACRDLVRRVDADVWSIWDDWCQRGENYDPVANETAWYSKDRKTGSKKTWRTLVKLARKHDFDIKPWKQNTRVVTDYTPAEPDPEVIEETDPLEDLLMQPKGLMGALRDYAYDISPRDHYVIPAAGAMAAVGALSDRCYVVQVDNLLSPPACLSLVLANSGVGKETLMRMLGEVAALSDHVKFCAGYPSSVMVHKELSKSPTQLIVEDEYGRALNTMKNGGDHQYGVAGAIMQYATRFMSTIPAVEYRNTSLNIPEVHNPLLVSVAMTAPAPFYEALGGGDVDGGSLGRRLILTVPGMPPRRRGVGHVKMPDAVKEAVVRLGVPERDLSKGFGPPEDPGDSAIKRNDGLYMYCIKPEDDAVTDLMFSTFDTFDNLGTGDTAVAPLYARAGELVSRLAGMYALSDAAWDAGSDLKNIRISRAHVIWARDVVTLSLRTIAPDVEENASAGDADAIRKRVLSVIRRCLKKGDGCIKEGEMVYAPIGLVRDNSKNRRKYRSHDVTSELRGLIDDGVIESVKIDHGGPTPKEYVRLTGEK